MRIGRGGGGLFLGFEIGVGFGFCDFLVNAIDVRSSRACNVGKRLK